MTSTYTFRLHAAPQRRPLGWFGRVLTAAVTLVLFIGGFLVSLLMLAVGGAILLATATKLWLSSKAVRPATTQRTTTAERDGHTIEGEYQVKQD